MPGGDRTGPNGFGQQTGRKAGFCSGFSTAGYMNRPGNFGGFGNLGGGRRGHRRMFNMTGMPGFYRQQMNYPENQPPNFNEEEYLKSQASVLGQQLDAINKRLNELEQPDA